MWRVGLGPLIVAAVWWFLVAVVALTAPDLEPSEALSVLVLAGVALPLIGAHVFAVFQESEEVAE